MSLGNDNSSHTFFFFLLLTNFASTWVGSTTKTIDLTFWLELATIEGSTRTQLEKKNLSLKFLGIAKGGTMANATIKIKVKI
jgi:hypothetical protein